MIIGQTALLDIARKILKPLTISEVRNIQGADQLLCSILDRWALNSPERLKALEKEGTISLLVRLVTQWEMEKEAMDSEEFYDMEMDGMSQWEIFKQMDINTEL